MKPDERGDFYIADGTPVGGAEEPLNRAAGLDFQGEERVNPEDRNGGTAPMDNELTGVLDVAPPTHSTDSSSCSHHRLPALKPPDRAQSHRR